MCGRARLPNDYSEIKIKLKIGNAVAPNLAPSWNIAPTQDMLCVILDPKTHERTATKMHWGLIPKWSKSGKMEYPTFNARGDIADGAPEFASKATFRDAWKKGRRCLIVTDGFYEWRKRDKQPFAIACVKDDLTIMAGLWEEWWPPGAKELTPEIGPMRSCTIVTTSANDLIEPLHDRMPVILDEAACSAWLGEVEATSEQLRALLAPFPSQRMNVWPVDKRVGNVRNNDPSLVARVDL